MQDAFDCCAFIGVDSDALSLTVSEGAKGALEIVVFDCFAAHCSSVRMQSHPPSTRSSIVHVQLHVVFELAEAVLAHCVCHCLVKCSCRQATPHISGDQT